MIWLIILSIINILFCLFAQLNVWRPLTFKNLEWFNGHYARVVIFILVWYWVIRAFRSKQIMQGFDVKKLIYSDDYTTQIRREFLINLVSFLLYQAILGIIFL